MNTIFEKTLKALRFLSRKVGLYNDIPIFAPEENPDITSAWIYNLLANDAPCMIGRYGSTEMTAIVNYLGVRENDQNIFHLLTGKSQQWWWNHEVAVQMQQWSGFFPPTDDNLYKFGEMMIEDSKQVDLLGSWTKGEYLLKDLHPKVKRIHIGMLDPFWATKPWSRILKGKRIVVVHPFAETIASQYEKRENLFKKNDVLPEFASLRIVKAVQSIGGESNGFKDWFEALEYMKNEIEKENYDICLIGCGAYGFPLAAHVKRQGKKAVHLGGSLQLLFGIMGNRWDHDEPCEWHGHIVHYASLENNYWVRPGINEKPKDAQQVENSCYW